MGWVPKPNFGQSKNPTELPQQEREFHFRVCQKALQNFEGYFEEVRRMADENNDKL